MAGESLLRRARYQYVLRHSGLYLILVNDQRTKILPQEELHGHNSTPGKDSISMSVGCRRALPWARYGGQQCNTRENRLLGQARSAAAARQTFVCRLILPLRLFPCEGVPGVLAVPANGVCGVWPQGAPWAPACPSVATVARQGSWGIYVDYSSIWSIMHSGMTIMKGRKYE